MSWVHGRDRHYVWCSMACHRYMVDRHRVWCSMVSSVTWDNVQNESHGFENDKYMCWAVARWDRSPPRVKDPVIAVRHDHRRGKTVKILERRAASYGENPETRDPQIYKHTELEKFKLISETVQWILIYKTKRFVLKNGH